MPVSRTSGRHTLMYHNSQSNTTSRYFSSPSKINSNSVNNFDPPPELLSSIHEQIVIYRTQEQINKLQVILNSVLKHKNTGRRSAESYFLKMIIGRQQKLGHCIVRQSKIGADMFNYGYNKVLKEKQIGRIGKKVEEAGLLIRTRTKKTNGQKAAYKYEATRLGLDLYYFYIMNNKSNIKIETLELPSSSVDNLGVKIKCPVLNEKMSGGEPLKTPMITGVVKKNVRSNMDIKKYKNININIIRVGCLGIKIAPLSDSYHKTIPLLEEKAMSNTQVEQPKLRLLVSDPFVSTSGKIDYNAAPIDLDNPPTDVLLFNWDHNCTEENPNTIRLGKVNYQNPERTDQETKKVWKYETQTNPKFIAKPSELVLSSQVFFMISQSSLSQNEKTVLIEALKLMNSSDEIKIKILELLVIMVNNVNKSGKKVTNFNMMVKSKIKEVLMKEQQKTIHRNCG